MEHAVAEGVGRRGSGRDVLASDHGSTGARPSTSQASTGATSRATGAAFPEADGWRATVAQ